MSLQEEMEKGKISYRSGTDRENDQKVQKAKRQILEVHSRTRSLIAEPWSKHPRDKIRKERFYGPMDEIV